LLYKEFRAGELIVVDVEPDPDSVKNEKRLTFRAVEGFVPAVAVELAKTVGDPTPAGTGTEPTTP
jgi:ATP-dependent Clp protease ATP-binding subunit ClpC